MATATLHVQVSRSEIWRQRAGMTESECRVLTMVLAGYWALLRPLTCAEIRANLAAWEASAANVGGALCSLTKRGWLREADKVQCTKRWVPTDRGWQILGFAPFRIG